MQTRSQQEQKESEIERMRAQLFEQSLLHREALQQNDAVIERLQKDFSERMDAESERFQR